MDAVGHRAGGNHNLLAKQMANDASSSPRVIASSAGASKWPKTLHPRGIDIITIGRRGEGARAYAYTFKLSSAGNKNLWDLPETTVFKSYATNQYSDLPGRGQLSLNEAPRLSMPTDATNQCCSQN